LLISATVADRRVLIRLRRAIVALVACRQGESMMTVAKSGRRFSFGTGIAVALLAAALSDAARSEGVSLLVANPAQLTNVGDAIIAAAAYKESGAYDRDVAYVAQQAADWISERAPSVPRPALVLDIDETALSNWEVITRDNFGRPISGPCDLSIDGPCGWAEWDRLGRDPAIVPTLRVFEKARAMNVAVFFITGRPHDQREATEKNLVAAGYGGYENLYTVPNGARFSSAVDFKAPVRAEIERAGYTIIANMGDQPSDLFGGHAEKMFLLPNPFYRVR
jgi:predicted secreted acid phosphatase